MTNNTELIAEARAAEGDSSDLLWRLADALEAATPRPAAKYRTVRPADNNPQVGELVRTKWGSPGSAAVWRIDLVEKLPNHGRRERLHLHMVSLSSGRRDVRYAHNLEVVVPAE